MDLEAGPLGYQQEGGVSSRGWMGEEKHCCCLGGSRAGGHSLAQEHWFASGPAVKIGWRLLSQGEDSGEQTFAGCLPGASCLAGHLMDHLVSFPHNLLSGSLYVSVLQR